MDYVDSFYVVYYLHIHVYLTHQSFKPPLYLNLCCLIFKISRLTFSDLFLLLRIRDENLFFLCNWVLSIRLLFIYQQKVKNKFTSCYYCCYYWLWLMWLIQDSYTVQSTIRKSTLNRVNRSVLGVYKLNSTS